MLKCNSTLIDLGDELVDKEQPIIANITIHQLGLWLTATCCVLASSMAIVLMIGHAVHYSQPFQQKHIIRILAMIPIYSIISFVSYWKFRDAVYWQVLRDCYEAFAIASFFTLLCHYIEPSLHDQKEYFRRIKVKNWVLPISWIQNISGGQQKGPLRRPRSGLTWFNIIWIGVFQYCAVRVFFTFVSMASNFAGRYCESSLNPAFAHIWVMVFEGAAVSVAMYCLIQFYYQLREDLAEYKPFLKLLCVKLVIFFSFWQTLMISFLTSASHGVIKPTARVAYPDLTIGIPSMLLTIEMTIFAILHHFAFPWKPYDIRNSPDPSAHYKGGTFGWKAFLEAFNPWDIIKAGARGFRWLFIGRRHRETDISYKEPGVNNAIALERSRGNSIVPEHHQRINLNDGGMAGGRIPISRQDTMDRLETGSNRPEQEEGDYAPMPPPYRSTGSPLYGRDMEYQGAGLSPQVSHLDGSGDSKEYLPVEDQDREDSAPLVTHAQRMPRS